MFEMSLTWSKFQVISNFIFKIDLWTNFRIPQIAPMLTYFYSNFYAFFSPNPPDAVVEKVFGSFNESHFTSLAF